MPIEIMHTGSIYGNQNETFSRVSKQRIDSRNHKQWAEIGGYFSKSLWGETGKGKAEKETSEDTKRTLSEHSVRRARSDQRAGPERVLEVSRKV